MKPNLYSCQCRWRRKINSNSWCRQGKSETREHSSFTPSPPSCHQELPLGGLQSLRWTYPERELKDPLWDPTTWALVQLSVVMRPQWASVALIARCCDGGMHKGLWCPERGFQMSDLKGSPKKTTCTSEPGRIWLTLSFFKTVYSLFIC